MTVARRVLIPTILGVAAGVAVDALYYAFIFLAAKELPAAAGDLFPCVWAPLFFAGAPLIAALVAATTSRYSSRADRAVRHPAQPDNVSSGLLPAGLLAGIIVFGLPLALMYLPQMASLFM